MEETTSRRCLYVVAREARQLKKVQVHQTFTHSFALGREIDAMQRSYRGGGSWEARTGNERHLGPVG